MLKEVDKKFECPLGSASVEITLRSFLTTAVVYTYLLTEQPAHRREESSQHGDAEILWDANGPNS